MTSKDSILKAIRAQRPEPAELPSLDGDWIRYEDPFAQFKKTLESVGGRCVRISSPTQIAETLNSIPAFSSAPRIVSFVNDVASTFDFGSVTDPHDLETIDWAILPAQLGVAENGAVWVNDEHVKHRAIYFIVQHLSLILPTDQIVNNMYEAYEKISVGSSSLGVFISGPSKTADIEQSLVIGAHGPRSLTVFCLDAPSSS
jgi:L-lactate dehydrogenase complex protein LldG